MPDVTPLVEAKDSYIYVYDSVLRYLLPVLVLVLGLWLGTPVYAEFRYAYPMVLCSPMALMTTLYDPEQT